MLTVERATARNKKPQIKSYRLEGKAELLH